jgi:hypothetical protein
MVMERLKQILMWVYALQLFLVVPWFLGSMYRDEQSIWVGTEFRKSMERFGASDTAFIVYLYALYYSAFLVIPYLILGFRYRDPVLRLLVSVWFAASAAIFAQSAFAFIRYIPSDIAYGWLLIAWVLATFFMAIVVKVLERERRAGT